MFARHNFDNDRFDYPIVGSAVDGGGRGLESEDSSFPSSISRPIFRLNNLHLPRFDQSFHPFKASIVIELVARVGRRDAKFSESEVGGKGGLRSIIFRSPTLTNFLMSLNVVPPNFPAILSINTFPSRPLSVAPRLTSWKRDTFHTWWSEH